MSLTAGSRLGPYEIVAPLGVGGMGEVYRARDTRLNRDVAIKVLPDLFAADVERVTRFTREAQTLAALNHPNIAQIYGLESQALVMELVEGDDLSHHISQGALPLSQALAIARQIIDALEAAHDAGIVHRDLKPANIKVRHDGTVKVLDFGLARTLDSGPGTQDPSNSPTLTARATQMGMIIGTAAYMSPEQARGRAVDKRTDVWAFGCVLYEMLAGKKAFDGEDATEIISSVVKTEPDWSALPATVPPHIRTIITRCLDKDRKARIPDLSVVRYMLDGTMPTTVLAPQPAGPARSASTAWYAATALFAITTMVMGVAWYRAGATAPTDGKFVVVPPDGTIFTVGNYVGATAPVISPDGKTLAFTAQDPVGKRMLYVRPIDSLVAQALQGTEGAAFPFWSPDSAFIGYSITGKLLKVSATGGPPQTLCSLNPGILSRGGTWSRDGVVVFNNGPAPLYRTSSAGGTEAVVMGALEDETGREFPSFLPDGRRFIFHAAGGKKDGLIVGSIDSAETTWLTSSESGAVFDETSGRLLFVRQGILLSQAFDPRTLALSGDPVTVAENVETAAVPGVVTFSISANGVLAYGIGQAVSTGLRMTWMNRQGKVLGTIGPLAPYRGLSLSPNGLHVAAHRHEGDGGDIWVTDVARDSTTRFTLDPTQENSSPVWSPKGDRVAFQSVRQGKPGVYVKAANGGDDVRLFEATTSRFVVPLSFWPDGQTLLFGLSEAATNRDMWTVSLGGEHTAAPRVQTALVELSGQVSPDGRWLAYQSDETGAQEIYIQPATAAPGKWKVSTGGGQAPRWRGDSLELFYWGAGQLFAVDIGVTGDTVVPGVPKTLFEYRGVPNVSHGSYFTSYDVTSDGERFLVSRRESEGEADGSSAPIVIVLNWRNRIGK